jgi:putative cardiolipin synthase
LDRTTSDLIIVSPYFVPGPDFTAYLTRRVSEGVRVRIMTNSLAANDVPLVHSGYMRYRKDLIQGGVELYEFKPVKGVSKEARKTKAKWSGSSRASLHGKFLGFDRRYVFVGSFNLDARSVALNTELGVYFESPRYAGQLFDEFDEIAAQKGYHVTLDERGNLQWTTVENGQEVTFHSEPEAGFWKRFGTGFMSIFVPESQL